MNDNYQAVILAAGRGSRMGKSTEHSHKCLTVLNGKTLLEWQQEALRNVGIKDITVVRGYRSEMIQGKFKVAENKRWAETNMVTTLFCVPEFKHNTIISYSDIVYSVNHVKALIEKKGDIVITADKKWYSLWAERFEKPLEDAETFQTEGSVLKAIGKKNSNLKKIEAQYMGLLKFSPKGWKITNNYFNGLPEEKQNKLDMTGLLSALIDKTKINVVFIEGKWCEVDSYNDVMIYEKLLKTKDWKHDWRK